MIFLRVLLRRGFQLEFKRNDISCRRLLKYGLDVSCLVRVMVLEQFFYGRIFLYGESKKDKFWDFLD